jgi:hypothetical protein
MTIVEHDTVGWVHTCASRLNITAKAQVWTLLLQYPSRAICGATDFLCCRFFSEHKRMLRYVTEASGECRRVPLTVSRLHNPYFGVGGGWRGDHKPIVRSLDTSPIVRVQVVPTDTKSCGERDCHAVMQR